ncbi:MAG: DUF2935 domain-containing protein [Lachnospiraceae bacterium]|nr:DUF2935 domain-containing protein [Lachnospiraceae bacterium]
MDKTQEYIVDSLEEHLFFARIMKEHAFFLKVGFLPPNAELAREAERLLRSFEAMLSRTISLSDCVVRGCVLESGEIVTVFTDRAEQQTQRLTGTPINRSLTARAMGLRACHCGGNSCVSQGLAREVRRLNQDGLRLVNAIIGFKERVLRGVRSCDLFTVNYPLLIEHILREARLYRSQLMRLEGEEECSREELRGSELFWNQIMMEHALFIRGLLDPDEEELVCTANDFAKEYRCLLEASAAANDRMISDGNSLALTRKFRDFKRAGVEGIEACRIRSLILPLLADHVLREANHYIRLLED